MNETKMARAVFRAEQGGTALEAIIRVGIPATAYLISSSTWINAGKFFLPKGEEVRWNEKDILVYAHDRRWISIRPP
jgi:hypothetical protein